MKKSAGILLYKKVDEILFVLLVHPGGPFWKNKNLGSWSIPKGEFTDEEPLAAAIREFAEETGTKVQGNFIHLNPVKLKSGKIIHGWALEQDFDLTSLKSNNFEMEWPPKSGRLQQFPEVDRAAWFTTDQAHDKINSSQSDFIRQLISMLEN